MSKSGRGQPHSKTFGVSRRIGWRASVFESAAVLSGPYTQLRSWGITRLNGGNDAAQGNALGIADGPGEALKGRHTGTQTNTSADGRTKEGRGYFAPSGLGIMRQRYSRGVALGCTIPALQGGRRSDHHAARPSCGGARPRELRHRGLYSAIPRHLISPIRPKWVSTQCRERACRNT